MLAHFQLPFGWTELIKRTIKEAVEDDVFSLAAQQAYYFLFSLFPAILTLVAIASFFPVANLTDEVFRYLGRFAPPEVLTIINDQLLKISKSGNSGLLTFAFLLTIWSSSGAMASIISTLNAAYDITESRSWINVRVTAVLLTIGVAVFILISIALLVVGPPLAEKLAVALRMGPVFAWTWKILQWPVVFALMATGIAIICYYAPDAEQEWVWLTPGAVVATTLWIVASVGLRFYLVYIGHFNETYGTLGGFMALLLWLYVTALAILFGAEMNAEIEHSSPYGKAPGEKLPGQKKKIGLAAWRDYEQRLRKGLIPSPARRAISDSR
jgi:membrane protein